MKFSRDTAISRIAIPHLLQEGQLQLAGASFRDQYYGPITWTSPLICPTLLALSLISNLHRSKREWHYHHNIQLSLIFLDLQNPKIFWSMGFTLFSLIPINEKWLNINDSKKEWSYIVTHCPPRGLWMTDGWWWWWRWWSVSREFKCMISFVCTKIVAKSNEIGFAIVWAIDIPL